MKFCFIFDRDFLCVVNSFLGLEREMIFYFLRKEGVDVIWFLKE